VEEGKLELKIQVCHDATHVAHALISIVMNKCKISQGGLFSNENKFLVLSELEGKTI